MIRRNAVRLLAAGVALAVDLAIPVAVAAYLYRANVPIRVARRACTGGHAGMCRHPAGACRAGTAAIVGSCVPVRPAVSLPRRPGSHRPDPTRRGAGAVLHRGGSVSRSPVRSAYGGGVSAAGEFGDRVLGGVDIGHGQGGLIR